MRLKPLLTALLHACLSTAALAQPAMDESARLQQRALAAACASCHGTEGRAVEGSALPDLAGLPRAYLLEQMQAFRDGLRPATVMDQLARGLTDAQITSLASYFAAQKR